MLLIELYQLNRLQRINKKINKLNEEKRSLTNKLKWCKLLPSLCEELFLETKLIDTSTKNQEIDKLVDVSISNDETAPESIQKQVELTDIPNVNTLEKNLDCSLSENTQTKEFQDPNDVVTKTVDLNVVEIQPVTTATDVNNIIPLDIENVEEIKIELEIDVRIVALDFEKEEVFVQILGEETLEQGNSNVHPVGADKQYLEKLTPGEKCRMIVYSNGITSFILESGESVAC